MGMPGGIEWVVILLVVVLLFGAKKIPALAEGLGKGIKNFKKSMKEEEVEVAKSEPVEERKETTTTTNNSTKTV
jgi:sec-independent protein translocase protein TatA